MDRNLLLAFVLSFLVLAGWSFLQPPPAEEPVVSGENVTVDSVSESKDVATESSRKEFPVDSAELAEEPKAVASLEKEEVIVIDHDLFRAEFTTRGGGLKKWELKKYHDRTENGPVPVNLVSIEESSTTLVTPLVELGLGDLSKKNFHFRQPDLQTLVFEYQEQGIEIRKTYLFSPEKYRVQLQLEIRNHSDHSIHSEFEIQWAKKTREGVDFRDQGLIAYCAGDLEKEALASFGKPGFFSGIFGGGGKFNAEEETLHFSTEVEWAGTEDRYFLEVFLPDEPVKAKAEFVPLQAGDYGMTTIRYQPYEILPGKSKDRSLEIYLGPKEGKRLSEIGRNLKRAGVLGYSWVSPLTRFFTWLLGITYQFIPNYGLAIIFITVLVRLITAPIVGHQMKSMKKMSAIQPQVKELQEKYKDDRQKMSQAMMSLYKEQGVNPLGGCLPALLQFPVFIGLFFALQSSIELRQAPFFGWITDLSAPDVLFAVGGLDFRLLPFLMGGSMFLQQRLTPMTTMDPLQRQMMTTFMPLMLLVVAYQFPSGLVLYWVVSNLLGIAQQVFINRREEKPQSEKQA